MVAPFSFATSRPNAALVILFPPGVKGLFNAEVHGLVREVQSTLGDICVTYALSDGGSPDLRDAMAAARFAGCEAAVVVRAAAGDAARWSGERAAGDWMLDETTVPSGVGASAVVDAYLAAVGGAAKAA